ncbi:MAG: DUF1361 domain-containing protein [Alteromonadaceae bacterium]|nr:DUF1361 domain-containing protein [Alteromonadaceae bacterium]
MVTPHFTVAKNIILAEIPFILGIYLFVVANKRGALWWLLAAVCLAFLPNSAYTITDIIHFIAATKDPSYSWEHVYLFLMPSYALYFFIDFQFYVITIQMAKAYVAQHWGATAATWFTPIIHFLCAVGVYLGRVQRLNSTDIVNDPLLVFKDLFYDLTHLHPLMVILGFFVLFYSLYFLFTLLNNWVWKNHLAKYWQAIEQVKKA